MSWAIITHIDQGVAADRPAANAVPGRHYGWWSTDTKELSISDGSTWTTIGPGSGGVPTSRTLTAGAALTGGGDLTADRTFDVAVDGSTIEVLSDALRVKDGGITIAKLSFDPATQAELDAVVGALGSLAFLSAVDSAHITDGTIVNADVNASAAIAYSKLALGSSIVSADIVDGTLVNADINAAAAIAYSKLNLASSIVTGDIVDGTLGTGDLSAAALSALRAWTVVTKASDETVTGSTVLQDDDELFFTASSGVTYEGLLLMAYLSASGGGTPDIKFGVGEDTVVRGFVNFQTISPTDGPAAINVATDQGNGTVATAGTGTVRRLVVGRFHHAGAGGTFKLKWAQNTSSGSPNGTTVKAGSLLLYRAI